MRKNQSPTPETIKDGLTKLLREVGQLKTEIQGLTKRLGGFTEQHPIPQVYGDIWKNDRAQTDEPRSEVRELIWELKSTDNLETPTRALLAILKDLDGALRDVRAARLDIDAIMNDGGLRDDFKRWLDD